MKNKQTNRRLLSLLLSLCLMLSLVTPAMATGEETAGQGTEQTTACPTEIEAVETTLRATMRPEASTLPDTIPLVPPHYQFDMQLLEQTFQQGAKALILCNPSNPCGKVFTRQELEQIAALAIRYDAFVITDEVYEHIIYAPYQHIAMASLPGMWERTITCNSFSKTYSITGWRLGYLIAPAPITEACRKVHDFLTVGAPAPLQEAVVTALNFPASYYTQLQQLYTEKRQFFLDGLDRLGISHNVPQATYYVMVDISPWLALPQFTGYNDLAFCEWMTREIGVAAVPGSSFFREPVNHLIRLHFAREAATLEEALSRLEKMVALLPEHTAQV